MSTKVAKPQSKKAVSLPAIKPKSKGLGIVELKSSRMIFDDSTYAGKYVFSLTDNQLSGLQAIESEELSAGISDVTNHSWSTNDYGNKLKVSSTERMFKGTYNLTLKMTHWTMGPKSGFSYIVTDREEVEASSDTTYARPPLKSLGCLI